MTKLWFNNFVKIWLKNPQWCLQLSSSNTWIIQKKKNDVFVAIAKHEEHNLYSIGYIKSCDDKSTSDLDDHHLI